MKLKLTHFTRQGSTRSAHAGRRGGKRRHYTIPIGNRTEALQSLEEVFDVNDARFSPSLAVY